MAPREPYPDDSELGATRAPLISKAEPDFILRTLVACAVGLLGFICIASWNSNRELGEIRAQFTATIEAMDRRLTALEQRAWNQR